MKLNMSIGERKNRELKAKKAAEARSKAMLVFKDLCEDWVGNVTEFNIQTVKLVRE